MDSEFLFSSEYGDIPIPEDMLARPFMVDPVQPHPHLTLGDFLGAVRRFVWSNGGRRLTHQIEHHFDIVLNPEDASRFLLRYEKYGTLYHVTSVEVRWPVNIFKFAVNAAYSQEAKQTLESEAYLLDTLNSNHPYSYIPNILFKEEVEIGSKNQKDTFSMTLANWFDNYHEWHFAGDGQTASTAVVWDTLKGYRAAGQAEVGGIIHQATKILTLYYDVLSGHSIRPWHHGAGDFIVNNEGPDVAVRLVTVRGLGPVPVLGESLPDVIEQMVNFFLETSLKMRLDKHEGVGDPVWADAFVLPYVLTGFREGLEEKEKQKDLSDLTANQILQSIKALSANDLENTLSHLINTYRHTEPQDYPFLAKRLKDHCTEMYAMLQRI
jgi:hypothetical protein